MISLRRARESCERSEADVARVLGITEATVKRWERTNDPKVSLTQMPLFLALYGLEVDIEKAKEELKTKSPSIDDLIIEAEQKATWSPLWIRMSVVIPTCAKELIDIADITISKVTSRLDDRRPIRLGQLLINGAAEIQATHGGDNEKAS